MRTRDLRAVPLPLPLPPRRSHVDPLAHVLGDCDCDAVAHALRLGHGLRLVHLLLVSLIIVLLVCDSDCGGQLNGYVLSGPYRHALRHGHAIAPLDAHRHCVLVPHDHRDPHGDGDRVLDVFVVGELVLLRVLVFDRDRDVCEHDDEVGDVAAVVDAHPVLFAHAFLVWQPHTDAERFGNAHTEPGSLSLPPFRRRDYARGNCGHYWHLGWARDGREVQQSLWSRRGSNWEFCSPRALQEGRGGVRAARGCSPHDARLLEGRLQKPMPAVSPHPTPSCYRCQTDESNNVIRRISLPTGAVTTLVGFAGTPGSADGVGSAARFFQPTGVAVDPTGTFALVVRAGIGG